MNRPTAYPILAAAGVLRQPHGTDATRARALTVMDKARRFDAIVDLLWDGVSDDWRAIGPTDVAFGVMVIVDTGTGS